VERIVRLEEVAKRSFLTGCKTGSKPDYSPQQPARRAMKNPGPFKTLGTVQNCE
jgi:hypothetical protein